MKICPNCGRENNDSNRFCAGCGTKLAEDTGKPMVYDLQPEDEETMADTGYDFSSIEDEETMFLDEPALAAPKSTPAADAFENQSYYDMDSLEDEETMVLSSSRREKETGASSVPDFSYKGNVPVYKEGEGIKNPQPAYNTTAHSAFKPVKDDELQPENSAPAHTAPQPVSRPAAYTPPQPVNSASAYAAPKPVPAREPQPAPQPVNRPAAYTAPQPVNNAPSYGAPQHAQPAAPTPAEEAAYMNARQHSYQPVPGENYGQKKPHAHGGHPGSAASTLDGIIEKLPGGKSSGCFFFKLTAAAVIVMALVMYSLVSSLTNAFSNILNFWDSPAPDLSGVNGLATMAVIFYWGTIVLAVLALIELYGKNKKADKNIFTDARLWMTLVIMVLTFMSYDSLKAAMMSLNVMNGDLSWDMLGDALSIGNHYKQTKTYIIINAIVAIAALVWDFVQNGSSAKIKLRKGAAAAGKTPASGPAPMYGGQPQRPQPAQMDGAQPQRPQPAPMGGVQAQRPQPAPMGSAQPQRPQPAPQAADASADPEYITQIRGLKQLLDDGIITEEEFENKKRFLLGL